ncbi:hypothetical protein, partial [Domibacillus tundrae]|uniref:hypothetical protein n=1 Tax=Domibacillus tundrae TaxID=1587527 RepID=UPI003399AE4F
MLVLRPASSTFASSSSRGQALEVTSVNGYAAKNATSPMPLVLVEPKQSSGSQDVNHEYVAAGSGV